MLPERIITEGPIAEQAGELRSTHRKILDLQKEEKELKSELNSLIKAERLADYAKKEVVGLYKIMPEGYDPVQVQFKLESKGKVDARVLELDAESDLDNLFGDSKDMLWEKVWRVSDVTDPIELIKDLVAKSIDPLDVLSISVRAGSEKLVSQASENVKSFNVLAPKKDFLANLKEMAVSTTEAAWAYVEMYLKPILKPTIVQGSKGTKK